MCEADIIVISRKMNPKYREIRFTIDDSIVIIINEDNSTIEAKQSKDSAIPLPCLLPASP